MESSGLIAKASCELIGRHDPGSDLVAHEHDGPLRFRHGALECLTLWLSNLLALGDHKVLASERQALKSALSESQGTIVLVSNEVGSGIVPTNELARRFRDEAGILHQELAQLCDQVVWMVAGLPVLIKAQGRTTGERA